jgi:serine/threonine-protein kinase HipA
MDGGPWIARLPQEDFCQALGHSPNQKYEKEGRPGMDACLRLLDGSADAEVDRLSAHAAGVLADGGQRRARQELLALHRPGDAYAMTPLYDVISQVHGSMPI